MEGPVAQRQSGWLITNWFLVRIQAGPPLGGLDVYKVALETRTERKINTT